MLLRSELTLFFTMILMWSVDVEVVRLGMVVTFGGGNVLARLIQYGTRECDGASLSVDHSSTPLLQS